MRIFYIFLSVFLLHLVSSCGSFKPKYLEDLTGQQRIPEMGALEKRIYLIGDAGGAEPGRTTDALAAFEKLIATRDTKKDHLVFLGDNIYDKGLYPKDHKKRSESEHKMDVQLNAAKSFKGTTVVIPGNHDWYNDGVKGLKRQEKYVEDGLDDDESFQPENGCAVETKELTDEVVLVTIDTQWYISDWDRYPTINDECDIKSREAFFIEMEDIFKDYNEMTIVVAMHHPALTYGLHGGYFNLQKHLFPSDKSIPLPIIGTLVTLVRSQGGVSPQDRFNNRYNELMSRLITMAQSGDRIIFTSGHEHTLQYIEAEGIKQIVSGSGSKRAPVSLGKGASFVSGEQGFAVLDVYSSGGSVVTYYDATNGEPSELYSTVVHKPEKLYNVTTLPESFEPYIEASIYPQETTNKSDGYTWFWGNHYRYIYGTEVKVPVATIDTLYGGLSVVRKGGGHQTRSLRLQDSNGKNYALRAIKKSAVQFLQTVVFKETFVKDAFRETLTEDAILDFYTSSHPYGGFVVTELSDAVGIYHTNPYLFYMPKHKALGKYNEDFGDELYIIEERPDNGFLDVPSFGTPDAIESTSDVLENLRKDEKYSVDEPAYIRARLFDMLIGDWDRHQDQWRWSRFDISDDNRIYRPIPRDRDQVFSNYDGAILDFLKTVLPASRQFQEFDAEMDDYKWINLAGIRIDRRFTETSDMDAWVKEAEFISSNLTDEIIDRAFLRLPPEVQDETSDSIKANLKSRKSQLVDFAKEYYKYLAKLAVVTGTDKDDYIEIERLDDKTVIKVSRIKDGGIQPPFKERTVNSNATNEIWVYALDDDDRIQVKGKGNNPIRLRIIGGQNNDTYTVENGRRVRIYDHKSKPNTIERSGGAKLHIRDNYRYNTYRYDKYILNTTNFLPSIAFNPDDGIRLGLAITNTVKGFKNDPFQVRHNISGGYYFATDGFLLTYNGEFANIFDNWNVLVGGTFTSDNFTRNFFGFGNDTENFDDEEGLDFNRVRTEIRSARVGVAKNGHYGSRIEVTGKIEGIEVQETAGRFIVTDVQDPEFFDSYKTFGNVEILYQYAGYDEAAYPTRGMFFNLRSGITMNLEDSERTFGYVHPSLEFFNALTRNRKLVLRSKVQGQFNIGDAFEFYQAAVLGDNTGLRGYRTERFSGESALAFGGDLRYSLLQFDTGLLPLKMAVFGGYDIGRVWLDGEDSNTWHDSVGGGIILNAVDALSGRFGLFASDDGLRFTFGFGISL